MDYIFRWMGAKFLGPEYAVSEAGETMTLRATEAESAAGTAVQSDDDHGCSAVFRVRVDHDAQRKLLQVRQLRRHQRLQLEFLFNQFEVGESQRSRTASYVRELFYWGKQIGLTFEIPVPRQPYPGTVLWAASMASPADEVNCAIISSR